MTASDDLLRYVERWGLLFEEAQLPPVAGRIWGWLLMAEEGSESKELCEALGVTKGAVSTSVRLLEGAGLVARERSPGERAYRYRVRDDAMEALLEKKLESLRAWRRLATEGADLARDEGRSPHRLKRLASFYGFLEERQVDLMDEWLEERS